jgi:uroporphyrin-III C-methyltransferase/precorrin-2 dehydrogenase/sirohydrochlorin ferrochelatase
MGLIGLAKICQSLIQYGSPESLPAALIQQGTTPAQRVITGTLVTLPKLVEDLEIKPPTLIIIGTVVGLHKQLAWFNNDSNN